MRESNLPHGAESRNILTLSARFRQPENCSITACSAIKMYEKELARHRRTEANLRESILRESALLREKDALLAQKDTLAKESEHRLLNGLQLIKSILAMQSRAAKHPETASQLSMAAKRISTLARVHQHLHAMDALESIEFKQYLATLCKDISDLLPDETTVRRLRVEGVALTIPRATATPLAFIASELITNSIKYARGRITVSLQPMPNGDAVLSVSDDGPGLPETFDPAATKGLGMRIIAALTGQIHGKLSIAKGEDGRGACFSVAFNPQA